MRAYALCECNKLMFTIVQKQYHVLIVLVQLYIEPGTDFNGLFFYSFLALSL